MSSYQYGITEWHVGKRCAKLALESGYRPAAVHHCIYVQGQGVRKQHVCLGYSRLVRSARTQGTSGRGRWNGNRDETGEVVEKTMREGFVWSCTVQFGAHTLPMSA